MAGVSAQGATFTFTPVGGGPFGAIVTGVSVETPVAEVTDLTAASDGTGTIAIVPTGEWSGGSVSVDYIHAGALQVDPQTLVRKNGRVFFGSPNFTFGRQAILESATTEASTGDIVRGTLRFRVTDYYGS
jgi:hypothetical protein